MSSAEIDEVMNFGRIGLLGIIGLLSYVYMAGVTWRGLKEYAHAYEWNAFEDYCVLGPLAIATLAWPLFLTGKYLVLGLVKVWRGGLIKLLQVLAWPLVTMWRSGAGVAPEKPDLPDARVVRDDCYYGGV